MLLIFKALLHNKASYLLMTFQIAITLAVLINALALVQRSQEIIEEPTGLAQGLIAIRVVPFGDDFNDVSYWQSVMKADLLFMRQYPGVINASISNSFPGDFGSNSTITPAGRPDDYDGPDVGVFHADEEMLDTLGVDLVAGRNFTQEEIYFSRWPSADKSIPQLIILTDTAADLAFGDEQALGKVVQINGTDRTVIGVTGTYRGRIPILGDASSNAFIPGYVSVPRGEMNYIVRVEPTEIAHLMKDLETEILKRNDARDVEQVRLVGELVARGNGLYTYGGLVLLVISLLLVFTTALGIFGVAYFSVTKRRRQIGVRRALGATRGDIMRYFLLENLLTTGTGVIVGSLLAIGLNVVMTQLGLGRADWYVTLAGMIFVLVVGQAAVLIPAYRAAQVDPAIATRS